GRSGNTKKFLKKLIPLISMKRNLDDLAGHPRGLVGVAEEDLTEDALVNKCISDVLENLLPSFTIPYSWYFRTIPIENGFFIDTNFDFEYLTDLYHKIVPKEHSSITGPYLVN